MVDSFCAWMYNEIMQKVDKIALLKEKFVKYYRALPVQKLAAAAIGKDEDTIIRWKKTDAGFADQIGFAKADWAMTKTKKIKSEEWLLERIMKDHFSPRNELVGDTTINIVRRSYLENGNNQ